MADKIVLNTFDSPESGSDDNVFNSRGTSSYSKEAIIDVEGDASQGESDYTSTWSRLIDIILNPIGSVPTQDDGVEIVASPSAHNFTGAGVGVTDVGGVATINIPGGGSIPTQDDGVEIVALPTAHNFTGAGVGVTDVGGVATINIVGNIPVPVQDDGVEIVANPSALNFTGDGVAVTDVGGVATIDIPFSPLPYVEVTDPSKDDAAIVATAIIDANDGAIVEITAPVAFDNNQDLESPTDTTPGAKKFELLNADASVSTVGFNGQTLNPGESITARWDGSAWVNSQRPTVGVYANMKMRALPATLDIIDPDTPVAVNDANTGVTGFWELVQLSDNFVFDSVAGTLTYVGIEPRRVLVLVHSTIEKAGAGSQPIGIQISKNGTEILESLTPSQEPNPTFVGSLASVELIQNDFVGLSGINVGNNNDIEFLYCNYVVQG